MTMAFRYHHIGIPTEADIEGMEPVPHLRIHATDHESNPFGIQWMRYDPGCPLPELVRKVAHVAFEVEDLREAIKGQKVIIEPNSPSPGVLVAFIEVNGAPVELLEYGKV
ncbi:MAG: hypothetical protein H6P95_1748 [Candidatus Aminicenantes bacterium]|nr:hypothetical protein [Candidatus Aminicenantes bacterium]